MKKLSILIAVLAVVLCLFTGCATTDGNVSDSDSGSIGSDMPDNAPTDRPNTDDGAMTEPDDDLGSTMPDDDTAPDSQAPGDGSENNAAANGPTDGQDDGQTDAGSGARNLPADGRTDTASGRPGQLVRGTGTADMVTGDTPATDRGASRPAPSPQAA